MVLVRVMAAIFGSTGAVYEDEVVNVPERAPEIVGKDSVFVFS